MKHRIITHTDMDGNACVVLFNLVYNDENSYYVLTPSNNMNTAVLEEVKRADESGEEYTIFITDLCVSKGVLIAINDIMERNDKLNITFYDHHDDSIKNKEELRYRWMYVSPDECGASLFAYIKIANEIRLNKAVCNFVEDVRVRDLYLFEKSDRNKTAAVLHNCLLNYRSTKFIKYMTERLKNAEGEYDYLTEHDYYISDITEKNRQKYISECGYALGTFKGYSVATFVSSRFISEICSKIFKENPNVEFAVAFNPERECMQIRSPLDGINLIEVFENANGGHPHALSIDFNRTRMAGILLDHMTAYSDIYVKEVSNYEYEDDNR